MNTSVEITKEQVEAAVNEVLRLYTPGNIVQQNTKWNVESEPAERGVSIDKDKKRVEFSFDIKMLSIEGSFELPARLDVKASVLGISLGHTVIDPTNEVSFNPQITSYLSLKYGFVIRDGGLRFFGHIKAFVLDERWDFEIFNISSLTG